MGVDKQPKKAARLAYKVFNYGNSQCLKAWAVLKKIPEYKNDYIQQESLAGSRDKMKKIARQFQKKWGFSPLDDPNNRKPSFQFVCLFKSILGKSYHEELAIGVRNLKLCSREGRRAINIKATHVSFGEYAIFHAHNVIGIDIDLSSSDIAIFRQLAKLLQNVRKQYGIKRKSVAKYDEIIFITKTLQNIGYSGKQIDDYLTPEEYIRKAYDDPARESYRKKIYRRKQKLIRG